MLKVENQVFSLGAINGVGNEAKWKKGSAKLGGYLDGICTSVTLRWVRKTADGGNITSAADLGNAHSMNIAFGAADLKYKSLGMNGHFQAHGLRPVKTDIRDLKSYHKMLGVITETRGLLCVILRDKGGSGHAIGFKVSPGKGHSGYQYLDPNDGLYRWPSRDKQAFVNDVAAELRSNYSCFYGGQFEIYKMVDD